MTNLITMKIIFAIFFLFLMSNISIYAQTEGKQVKSVEKLNFPGESSFKKIPTNIGQYFEMPSNCAPKPTSFITANEFVFGESEVGRIKNCEVIYTCASDTLRMATIVMKDAEGVKQAGIQAGKQFGKPKYTKEGRLFV